MRVQSGTYRSPKPPQKVKTAILSYLASNWHQGEAQTLEWLNFGLL
jgi:hypothetical protein